MRYRLKVLFRRLLPARQDYDCINGHPITERWRKPCPECGSLNRGVRSDAVDFLGFEDKA